MEGRNFSHFEPSGKPIIYRKEAKLNYGVGSPETQVVV